MRSFLPASTSRSTRRHVSPVIAFHFADAPCEWLVRGDRKEIPKKEIGGSVGHAAVARCAMVAGTLSVGRLRPASPVQSSSGEHLHDQMSLHE